MIVCLQLFQETTSPASVKIYPEVDFNISTQRAQSVNHLGPFGNVLVINDSYLWTNDSWRNKNAGLDHI
jgi:hypothetical protein